LSDVSSPSQTHVRLIDAENAALYFRQLYPLARVEHLEVCTIQQSSAETIAALKAAGYNNLRVTGNSVFVVATCHGELGIQTASHLLHQVFGVGTTPPRVFAPSSQAGLASFRS
jgi:hypothetical protein